MTYSLSSQGTAASGTMSTPMDCPPDESTAYATGVSKVASETHATSPVMGSRSAKLPDGVAMSNAVEGPPVSFSSYPSPPCAGPPSPKLPSMRSLPGKDNGEFFMPLILSSHISPLDAAESASDPNISPTLKTSDVENRTSTSPDLASNTLTE